MAVMWLLDIITTLTSKQPLPRFVAIRSSGIVMSERGLKETAPKIHGCIQLCPVTNIPFTEDDVVVLFRHIHDPEQFYQEHKEHVQKVIDEAFEKKKKKKLKKGDDADTEPEGESHLKRLKVDPSKTIEEKMKSSSYSSIFVKEKNKKITPENLMMMAPGGMNGTQGSLPD